MFINTINPIIFQYSFITVRWYGLFLAIGVALAAWIIVKLFKENNLSVDFALSFVIWLVFGGLIGARLGHIIFYELDYYLANPGEIIFINHGGLSSHGLTLGLIITFFLFVKIKKINWQKIIDLLVIPIPLLAAFIRLGNFFNSEIIGRPTNLPWGVKFPLTEANPVFRHPSQIYESLTALGIFIILFVVYKKFAGPKASAPGRMTGSNRLPPLFLTNLFILLYFSTRFLIEFVKVYQTLSPDQSPLTMGQYLSIPFILWSVGWFIWKFSHK